MPRWYGLELPQRYGNNWAESPDLRHPGGEYRHVLNPDATDSRPVDLLIGIARRRQEHANRRCRHGVAPRLPQRRQHLQKAVKPVLRRPESQDTTGTSSDCRPVPPAARRSETCRTPTAIPNFSRTTQPKRARSASRRLTRARCAACPTARGISATSGIGTGPFSPPAPGPGTPRSPSAGSPKRNPARWNRSAGSSNFTKTACRTRCAPAPTARGGHSRAPGRSTTATSDRIGTESNDQFSALIKDGDGGELNSPRTTTASCRRGFAPTLSSIHALPRRLLPDQNG